MTKHKVDKTHRMDGTKLLWHMDRVHKFYRDGERIAPLYIDIGVTKKCNISCIYCFGEFQDKTNDTIPREPLLNTFYQAPRLGVKSIGVIGDGDPTLNPHIYDAMDIGKEGGLDIAFSTNGVLLNDEKMENILRNNTWMRFNLSAGTRQGYKKIHRRDKFDIVKKNIQRMVELKEKHNYKCEVGLQSVFIPTEVMTKEVIPESQLALDAGVDYFLIKQCSLPDEGQAGMLQFDLDLYNTPKINNLLQEAEDMSTEKTKIIPKWISMNYRVGKRPYERCVDVPLLFQISGNGKCYPCGYLFNDERYCYGDLNKNTLEEILDSDKYWNIIDYMIKEFDVNKQCQGECRHDKSNEFIWDYIHKPKGVNFI